MFLSFRKKNKNDHRKRTNTSHSSNLLSNGHEDIQIDGEASEASHVHSGGTLLEASQSNASNVASSSNSSVDMENYSDGNSQSSRKATHEQSRPGSDLETHQNEENNIKAGFTKPQLAMCSKNPGHKEFISIRDLGAHHLPPQYQRQEWVDFIKLKGEETVLIEVSFTSQDRPDDFGFANIRGHTMKRLGSGTAFIMDMGKTEDCYCSEIQGVHQVSGCFNVMTVAHVVFDDQEARNAVIKFFYDDDNDRSNVVIAKGVRVTNVDMQSNRSVIECRTHDLTLCQRLLHARHKRVQLIQGPLATLIHHEPMVLLISHPHGSSKRVSTGKLLGIKEEGEVKRTKDGIELIGCILTYNTPTCPGSGGGTVNVIGQGEVCLAFAPHSAAKSDGENISGLGWTKYVKTMELRAQY